MSFLCEISGEPLLCNSDNNNDVVVTPSGHICIKRLLLTKLAENGGLDPFETSKDLPLSEDQLVTLQVTATTNGSTQSCSPVQPRPQATSLPSMLGLIQKEYDALVLELFDTRKALEETRRELSQALYQNDAAIRVVARVAQERDSAKQQLEQWSASAGANASVAPTTKEDEATVAAKEDEATVAAPPPASSQEQPSAKRRRILDPAAKILENDLPEDDLRAMNEVWTQLNKVRKPTLKAAAADAPSPKNLGDIAFLEKKAWHRSTNQGITCIASGGNDSDNNNNLTVTAGKDKHLVVYNEVDQVVQHTLPFRSVATCVDIGKTLVVAGNDKGNVTVFALESEGDGGKGEINVGAKVVDVRVHPTDQHICAATADGRLVVAYYMAKEMHLQQITTFQTTEDNNEGYTTACLHPDGLIYVAGTKTGKLHVWDFKNKTLAATLQLQDGEEPDGITTIAISNNGYHIAAGHDSATVRFWDLRKQRLAASIKCDEGDLSVKSIKSVSFDKAGKYAAMGGTGGVKITTVKQWGVTGSFETKHSVSGMVWSRSNSSSLLEVSCDEERAIQLYGVPISGGPISEVAMEE